MHRSSSTEHRPDKRSRVGAGWLPAALLTATLSGCGATPGPGARSADQPGAPTPVQQLERVVVAGYSTSELLAGLERARSQMLAGQLEQAAASFDRLRLLASDPEIAALACFDAGLAYQGLGQREQALVRFGEVAHKYPEQEVAVQALVHTTRLLGYLERWDALDAAASELLARAQPLPVMVRIEALGAKALGLVERGEVDRARVAIAKATALIERHGFGRSGAPPVQLAQVAFAEGELRRIESERIELTPVRSDFGEVLERRCQGLLDAQSAYTDAMRSRDAHYSAMSGYRVGQLYQQLHREAMAIAPPRYASLEQQRLFEAAMRLRYRILLDKGLKMMRATTRLGRRTGEDSLWVVRAEQAVAELERALADEKAALAKTPYTDEEIRAALDKLAARAHKP